MTRAHANLSNCYRPLPFRLLVQDEKTTGVSSNETKDRNRITKSRDYGNGQERSPHALRLLRMETSVTSATGSALVELGHTKVLCEVIGPTTTPSSSDIVNTTPLNMEEGTLQCEVKYLPNVGYPLTALVGASASQLSDSNSQQSTQISMGRMNNLIGGQEKELSSQLLASLSAAVPLQAYPKNLIHLKVTILQDDGSILSACITAASLALIDASIEVYDIVTSSTVAIIAGQQGRGGSNNGPPLLLADPTYDEMAHADAIVTISLLASWKEVTLWNQSGRLSSGVANEAISLCRDGCRTMLRFMRNALLDQDGN